MNQILIADDNDINRRLLTWQLDTLGFSCDDAASGKDILVACGQQTYSVILMDVNLGDTDGYTVTRTLREREQDTRTPIVAVTAHTGLDEYERCMASGMDDFLSKPIALSPLARLLIRWGVHDYRSDDEPGGEADGPLLLPEAVTWLRSLEEASAHEGLAREVARDFLDRAPAHLRRLQTAMHKNDEHKQELARFALHKNCVGIGARRLASATGSANGESGADVARLEAILAETSAEVERQLT